MSDQKEGIARMEDKVRREDIGSTKKLDRDVSEQEYAVESENASNGVLGSTPSRRGMQAPELVARMSPEERQLAEAKLKRKIDLRLMPMIIIMYILNYIDR
jgi:hypothetical protein